MNHIPKSHPRAKSLYIREKLVDAFDAGLVAKEGLMAHGRGEAFDYLIGEKTSKSAKKAVLAAAFMLKNAQNPVISVNGNMAGLCPKEIILLAKAAGAKIEVNLFYATNSRRQKIYSTLKKNGAGKIYGMDKKNSTKLSGLDSARRIVDRDGIYSADVVVVPLEDGDRTLALKKAGKKVITFDLNPMSRTAETADITIVDNVIRAINHLIKSCKNPRQVKFDNKKNLALAIKEIKTNLTKRASHA